MCCLYCAWMFQLPCFVGNGNSSEGHVCVYMSNNDDDNFMETMKVMMIMMCS